MKPLTFHLLFPIKVYMQTIIKRNCNSILYFLFQGTDSKLFHYQNNWQSILTCIELDKDNWRNWVKDGPMNGELPIF